MMRSGVPDIRWMLEDAVAEGDTVAARDTMRGTHRGPFLSVSPMGRPITVQRMGFDRFAGGPVVEAHRPSATLGLTRPIGAVPTA